MDLYAKKVPAIFFLQQVIKNFFRKNIFPIKTAGFKQVRIQKKAATGYVSCFKTTAQTNPATADDPPAPAGYQAVAAFQA
jgi:hypothetical protein